MWEEIIMSVDADGDGKVTFDEFQQAITQFLDENLSLIKDQEENEEEK